LLSGKGFCGFALVAKRFRQRSDEAPPLTNRSIFEKGLARARAQEHTKTGSNAASNIARGGRKRKPKTQQTQQGTRDRRGLAKAKAKAKARAHTHTHTHRERKRDVYTPATRLASVHWSAG